MRRQPANATQDAYRELATIIARFATADDEQGTAISSLFFARRSSPTTPLHTAQWPCFALVVRGTKRLTLGHEVYQYGVGDYLVVSLDLPVVSCVTRATTASPHLGLGMKIDPERLKNLLGWIDLPKRVITPDQMRGVAVHPAPPELVDATLRLLRLLDRPLDIPALAPLFEEEIMYRLLTGPSGPRLLQIAMTGSPSNKVAHAIASLREGFRRRLRIDALADSVGMSVSSLHHHFKSVTAMTPIQYQKQLRLHEARRLMIVERLDVGSAGYNVGYDSPSQFSREYSRHYGLSPLHDVKAARLAVS